MVLDARKIAIAVVLLLATLSSWWLSRKAAEPQVLAPVAARHVPDYSIDRFTAVALDERGKPRYRLIAERLVHYADDGSTDIDQPYLVHYGEGAPVHARAIKGRMPASGAEILMRGDVRVSREGDPNSTALEITADRMRIVLDR